MRIVRLGWLIGGLLMTQTGEAAGPAHATCRLYDSHAHLVSDDPVRYPRNPIPLSGESQTHFPPGTIGIPGGQHGPSPVNEKPTAEQMHRWMAEENVCGIAAVQKGMIYRTDNSYIVDAANLFPDEMKAIIIVDPFEAHTLDTIRKLAPRGIVGIRFFPVGVADKAAWLQSDESLAVWTLADELGIPVDLEAPPNSATMMPIVERFADRFPNLAVVLDHVFMPEVTEPQFGLDGRYDGFVARRNIYVKFTSLNMDVIREKGVRPEEVLRRTVDVFGPDRVMWGSDIGTSSGTYKEMVARAIDATKLLTEEERRKVLHDTGLRVFGELHARR